MVSAWGPSRRLFRPALRCVCMVAYWRGRDKGGRRRCDLEEGWNGNQGCFSTHQILVGRTKQQQGDATATATPVTTPCRLQRAEATRQAPTTPTVTVRFSGYSGAFPREKRKEPGASFQTLHTHRCRGFAVTPPQAPDHSCSMSQGNSRRRKKGQDRRVYCASLLGIGKREGKSLHFLFVCLLFLTGL